MRVTARRRAAAWAVAAVLALSARHAGAEGRRVLFVAAAPTPFSARVRAEIEAMGFEIEPAPVLAEDATTTAVAAARVIEGASRRVELWIADPATGALRLRAFVMPSAGDDETTQTVRASEQLRAFFQPLREPPPPPPPPVPVPLPAPAPVPVPVATPAPHAADGPAEPRPEPARPEPARPATPEPAARFVVGADLAVPFQPGGAGLDLGLRGTWRATRVVGVGAFVSVPLVGSTVQAAEGAASVAAPLFVTDVAFTAEPAPWMRLSASAGLGLAWVRTSGFASTPYHGAPSNVAAGLAVLGAEVAPRVTERLHLCLGGQVGFALPRVDIAFAGRTVATWGRPLGMLSGGVRVDL